MGSWLTYGLGSESQNLPGYVVLTAGRGSSGGASLWQSGFLPSEYAGVLFRNKGEPVLNLQTPPGVAQHLQRKGLDVLGRVNQARFEQMHDPEIASRIASYELAFRMQSAAPELIDLSHETQATLDAYGVDRKEPRQEELSRRRAGSVPCVRHQLPAGAADGRAGRAVRQHHPRLVGPSLGPGRGVAIQLPDGRSADCRADQGPEAARAVGRDAGGVGQRVRPHAAGGEPRRHARA